MMFDYWLLTSKLFVVETTNIKINVSNRMCFAWLTLFFTRLARRIKCYCFPTFKDLLAVYCHPVFKWECKGKGLLVITKIFPDLFSDFWSDHRTVLWRTILLFETDGKNTMSNYSSQFLFQFLFTQLQHCYELTHQNLSRYFKKRPQR